MLSDRLKQAMSLAGITQADLARACKVKPPSIHGWLNNKSKFLRGENLLLAATALKVNPAWLATGEGRMEIDDVNTSHPTKPLRWGFFTSNGFR
jgi:transcriptional regulator with XRE-family HTH domain